MRKILQLVPRLPFPADDGGKIGILGILRAYLKQGDVVRLGGFDEEGNAAAFGREFAGRVEQWFVEDIPSVRVTRSKLLVAAGLSPYVQLKYYSKTFERAVLSQVRDWRPDFVHLDHSHMGRYGLAIKRAFPQQPVYLRAHNIESVIWYRRAENAKSPIVRWIFRRQADLTQDFECRLFNAFDGIIAISEIDATKIRMQAPKSRVIEMPVGCDLKQQSPLRKDLGNAPRLCFLGSLDYTANCDGLEWFVGQVWPHVLRCLPGATFTIAGKSSRPLRFLRGNAGVRYVGFVPDVATLTNAADIAVVALRIAGGMRVKLLEFLSYGLPTIATSIGAEGVPAVYKDRATFRLADTAEKFVEELVALCRSETDRRALAEAGREMIAARFGWDSLIGTLTEWIDAPVGYQGKVDTVPWVQVTGPDHRTP